MAVKARSTLSPDRALVSMKGTPNSCTDRVFQKKNHNQERHLNAAQLLSSEMDDKRSLSRDASWLIANPTWSDFFFWQFELRRWKRSTLSLLYRSRCPFESNNFDLNKFTCSFHLCKDTFASGPEISCFWSLDAFWEFVLFSFFILPSSHLHFSLTGLKQRGKETLKQWPLQASLRPLSSPPSHDWHQPGQREDRNEREEEKNDSASLSCAAKNIRIIYIYVDIFYECWGWCPFMGFISEIISHNALPCFQAAWAPHPAVRIRGSQSARSVERRAKTFRPLKTNK